MSWGNDDTKLVSDRFSGFLDSEKQPPPGVVFPSEREGWARDTLRAVEEATGHEALRAYLPWLFREEYLRLEGEKKAAPYAHPVTAPPADPRAD